MAGVAAGTATTRSAPKALVTGVTSGIGAAVAARLVALGYRVVGVARSARAGDRVPYLPVTLDLADLDALPERLESLAREHADTELLVLAAGRGELGSLEELSYAGIRSLVELNLIAQVFLCRAFVPGMKRRGGGQVVIIGSEAALQGRRSGTAYCASKFGLRGFAQALRDEGAKSGLRVTMIHPGMVQTPFFDALDIEPGPDPEHSLVAEDVAEAVVLAVQARPTAVIDEIVLSPLTRVVRKKERGAKAVMQRGKDGGRDDGGR